MGILHVLLIVSLFGTGDCQSCSEGCKECRFGFIHIICSSCNDGYYYQSGPSCAVCHSACSTCISYKVCTSCKTGYSLIANQCCHSTCTACDASNQCTTCNDGHFMASNQCHQCPTECSKCTTSDQCQECIQGHHLDSNKCVPDTTCSPNCKDQQCDSQGICINGCASNDRYGLRCGKMCSDAIPHCSTCSATGGNPTCLSCKAGHVLQFGTCTTCSDKIPQCSTCSSTGGNPVCLSCNAGHVLQSGTCTACSNKIPQCSRCIDTGGHVSCITCNAGHVLQSGTCIACSHEIPQCSTCSDTDGRVSCNTCNAGYVLRSGIYTVCTTSGDIDHPCNTDSNAQVATDTDSSGDKTDAVTWILASVAVISIGINIAGVIIIVRMRKQHSADGRQKPAQSGGNDAPSYVNMAHLDTVGQVQGAEHHSGTRSKPPGASDNPYSDLDLVPGRDEHPYGTADVGT